MQRHIPGGNRADRVKACREAHLPPAKAPVEAHFDLTTLKKATLLAIADEAGVEVKDSMTKAQLADALEGV